MHLDVEDLDALDRPAIVGHGSNHAWVVRIAGDVAQVFDPLFGYPQHVPLAQFAEDYTGFAVVLESTTPR